jgi:hypothetical protein
MTTDPSGKSDNGKPRILALSIHVFLTAASDQWCISWRERQISSLGLLSKGAERNHK